VVSFFTLFVGYPLREQPKEMIEMAENIDEAKGRVKEAAGDLSDDEKLKREGKVDRAASTVKDKVDDVADKVKEKVGTGDGSRRDSETD
jgi:uncharacterized protein YjbJ (UPF0337 family)